VLVSLAWRACFSDLRTATGGVAGVPAVRCSTSMDTGVYTPFVMCAGIRAYYLPAILTNTYYFDLTSRNFYWYVY